MKCPNCGTTMLEGEDMSKFLRENRIEVSFITGGPSPITGLPDHFEALCPFCFTFKFRPVERVTAIRFSRGGTEISKWKVGEET